MGARAAVIFTTAKVTFCLTIIIFPLLMIIRYYHLCVKFWDEGLMEALKIFFRQISITIIGLVQLARGKASTSLREPIFKDSSTSPSSYALALYSGLWAVDGWDQANYVGGEIKNPNKNIPRAIHSSMAVVIVSYPYYNL